LKKICSTVLKLLQVDRQANKANTSVFASFCC